MGAGVTTLANRGGGQVIGVVEAGADQQGGRRIEGEVGGCWMRRCLAICSLTGWCCWCSTRRCWCSTRRCSYSQLPKAFLLFDGHIGCDLGAWSLRSLYSTLFMKLVQLDKKTGKTLGQAQDPGI